MAQLQKSKSAGAEKSGAKTLRVGDVFVTDDDWSRIIRASAGGYGREGVGRGELVEIEK